jgi:hypothetical protein
VCAPRLATPRNPDRPTVGADTEAWHVLLTGTRFLPWQRQVADLAGELDPATLREDPATGDLVGDLWYRLVLVEVMRQQGKSTLIDARLVHGADRRPDAGVVYAAQDRQMARRRLIDELADRKLARARLLRGRYGVRRSNGSEAIRWHRTGGTVAVVATTDTAGHGLTLDDAVLDEAFAHRDLTMIGALEPATLTRPDPQTWIVSTVGDGTDGMLQHYEDLAAAAVHDPTSRLAVVIYGAEPDDDRDDPDVWARVMPALGHTVTVERVAERRARLTEDRFDRDYLNRRPVAAGECALPLDRWSELARPGVDPAGPHVVAFDVCPDRSRSSIAVAGRHVDDQLGDLVAVSTMTRPGTSWVPGTVADLVAALRPVAVVADPMAGAGSLIAGCAARGVTVDTLTARDVVAACGRFYDAVVDGWIVHGAEPELDDAVVASRRRPLGDAWAWRRVGVDVSPLVAATLAVGTFDARHLAGTGRSAIL